MSPSPSLGGSDRFARHPRQLPPDGGEDGALETKHKDQIDSHSTLNLFRNGFTQFLESGDFSDLVLVCDGKEYHVHRLVVANASAFFHRMLLSEFKESRTGVVKVQFPDPDCVFPLILQFMYQGTIKIPKDKSIAVLSMADHFLMDELKQLVSVDIMGNVSRGSALTMIKKALAFNSHEVVNRCINVIAKNFSNLYDADFTFLPASILHRILSHDKLAVKSEYTVYTTVCSWLDVNFPDLKSVPDGPPGPAKEISDDWPPAQIAQALFEAVRFPFFTFEQLQPATQNPRIPRYLIIEGLMARLKRHETVEVAGEVAEGGGGGGDEVQYIDPTLSTAAQSRLKPRRSYGLLFEYHSDYDGRGIIHYIATNCGREPWTNAHASKRISISASSIERGHLQDVVGATPVEVWSKDVPASWIAIDLGDLRTVIPTHYTLRHGGNYRADSLRNWDLQGSQDGLNWTVLRRHVNDMSLNNNFQSASWPIPACVTAYRHFRILQNGHNSSNHNFLVLSGFEIYGELYEQG